MHSTPFELLELPDGRWYVVKPVSSALILIAGSFASLDAANGEQRDHTDPVGVYPSRHEAELAVQRSRPAATTSLEALFPWMRKD